MKPVTGHPLAPPWLLALFGLLNLRHPYLVGLVGRLGHRLGGLLLLGQGLPVVLIPCVHTGLMGLGMPLRRRPFLKSA